MRYLANLIFSLLASCFAPSAIAFDSTVPATGLPSAADYSSTLLPEVKGAVSWKTLAKVEPVKRDGKMVPEFSKEILGLDKQIVRIHGFMMPLDMTDEQKHFL